MTCDLHVVPAALTQPFGLSHWPPVTAILPSVWKSTENPGFFV